MNPFADRECHIDKKLIGKILSEFDCHGCRVDFLHTSELFVVQRRESDSRRSAAERELNVVAHLASHPARQQPPPPRAKAASPPCKRAESKKRESLPEVDAFGDESSTKESSTPKNPDPASAPPAEPPPNPDPEPQSEDPSPEDYSTPLRLEVGLDASGDWVSIPEAGCYQGFCAIGSPGSGKTAGVMYPLLHQLIGHPSRPGGLILEVKGNFSKQLRLYCQRYGREKDIIELKPGGKYNYNPLYQDTSASFLASRITEATINLSGGMDPRDAFWIKSAEDAVRGMIELCRLTRGYLTMADVFRLATDADALAAEMTDLDKKVESGAVQDDDAEGVDLWYTQWVGMEPRMKGNIVGEMTQFANLFVSMKEFRHTFCPAQKDVSFAGFEDALNKGQIILLNMPPSEYGNPAASVATLLKLDFFDTVLRRTSVANENRILRLYRELALARQDTKELGLRYADSLAAARRIRQQVDGEKNSRRKAALEKIVGSAKVEVLDRFIQLCDQDARGALSNSGHREREESWSHIQSTVEQWLRLQDARAGVMGVLNKRRPVFFMCDEYQNFVSGGGMGSMKSDNLFYDRSRESRCVNVVAFQDYTSLTQKLRADVAFNIISCLANKIYLRLECPYSAVEAAKACKLSEDGALKPADFLSLPAFTGIFKGSSGADVIGPMRMELSKSFEIDRIPGAMC